MFGRLPPGGYPPNFAGFPPRGPYPHDVRSVQLVLVSAIVSDGADAGVCATLAGGGGGWNSTWLLLSFYCCFLFFNVYTFCDVPPRWVLATYIYTPHNKLSRVLWNHHVLLSNLVQKIPLSCLEPYAMWHLTKWCHRQPVEGGSEKSKRLLVLIGETVIILIDHLSRRSSSVTKCCLVVRITCCHLARKVGNRGKKFLK